jgi:hypothetical protein
MLSHDLWPDWLGTTEACADAVILVQHHLPEGAWGNRPGALWVFPPIGARGRSAPLRIVNALVACTAYATDVLAFYWLRSHRLCQVDRLQRRHIIGIAGLEALPG